MKTADLTATIYLDIETAPGVVPRLDSFTADKRLKDPKKILDDLEEKRDKAWRQSLLDPFEGAIFVIGLAVNNEKPFGIWGEEKDLMNDFDKWLVNHSFPRIIAHFGNTFDFQWLFYKGLKYKLKNVVSTFCKGGNARLIDTALVMDNLDWKKYISLDKMSRLLLGKSAKTDVDGSMVFDLLKEGKGDKVIQYCIENDVPILRECCIELEKYGLLQ